MEIGFGLEYNLGLSFAEQREAVKLGARLGYTSAWTNAGIGHDPFQICAQWSAASADVVAGGLATGISVVAVPLYSAPALAAVAGTVGVLTAGRFVLGVGSGQIYSQEYCRRFGLEPVPPIALMRDWLVVLRRLLAGESVDYQGRSLRLSGVQLGFRPPRVPVYLGALGPQMVRLAGEAADGVALNWCTPERIVWSRERIAEGAQRAGRDPSEVKVVEYIRICVDEDIEAARRAYTKALLGYALARPGASKEHGYRGMFAQMGFDPALSELEEMRERGAGQNELVEAFPRDLLGQVGYYGPAADAPASFRRLAQGLDVALVRVVPARPGLAAVTDVLKACRPALIREDEKVRG